jgi:hypothetical protein
MFDEHIERPSIPIRWAEQFSRTARIPSFGRPVAVPLGRRRHPSLYIMTASMGLLIEDQRGSGFFGCVPSGNRSTASVKRANGDGTTIRRITFGKGQFSRFSYSARI